MTATTRSAFRSVSEPTLYVSFELGKKEWHLGMSAGFGVEPIVRTVPSKDWGAVDRAIAYGRTKLGVPRDSVVVSCYEAGRDGFWIHRALTARGIRNRVVDSSSIEVNRRKRRAKADRVDARKLVQLLVRVCAGETDAWQEVRVPTVADEAARHISRERTALTQERTRLRNQIGSWVATFGCAVPRRATGAWWTTVRDWSGAVLPAAVHARVARAHARVTLLADHIAELTTQQRHAVTIAAPTDPVQLLVRLKGVAATSASVLLDEGLVWRAFQNRRQLGGLLGFAPVKYDSGESTRDQGISRAGNTRLQSLMVQLAWGWVHWQPESALTQWYRERFGRGKRTRKIGIVALARKLFIALWRYATQGVIPAGAVMKPA